ncbi:uncharacterized protein DUF3558 [Saccharothrix saharensis]|uniref:Uncharacterized protein DUF3558 n=1 Tax=Saccharothrix saharensis TaxID=571190 RepID=A0A543JHD5_9PSEU|nr:DUF3558 domain-containing protein [Saccharothrix saharensis]TQM82257.1 uncharacterized protein DUF3558 [Saccharothrix saharensis]
MIKGLSVRIVLSLTVLGAVVTGCTTGGTATPGSTTTSGTTEQTGKGTTTTKPSGGGDSLADFDSCEVLNSVAAQLNLTEVEEESRGACGAATSPAGGVSIKAQPELAIADAVGDGKKSDTSIGPRKARLVEAPGTNTSCLVAVEVSPTSRVDVIASTRSLESSCELATNVATAIEPKLPK